jgi:hypothetical protein
MSQDQEDDTEPASPSTYLCPETHKPLTPRLTGRLLVEGGWSLTRLRQATGAPPALLVEHVRLYWARRRVREWVAHCDRMALGTSTRRETRFKTEDPKDPAALAALAEARRRLALADTQASPNQRVLGDPPPGRSALDRRAAASLSLPS